MTCLYKNHTILKNRNYQPHLQKNMFPKVIQYCSIIISNILNYEHYFLGFVSEPLSKFIYNSDIINQNNNKKSPNLSSSSQNTINITKGDN